MQTKNLGRIVPLKGVDYWTEVDKQEIVDDAVEETLEEIEETLGAKQDKNDNSLETQSKSVVGAINELNNKTGVKFTQEEKEKLAGLENYDDSEIITELGNKVDKEEGKGLSTNDFTNAEKEKLESLENYDDSEVREDITDLDNRLDTAEDDIETLQEENQKLLNQIPTNKEIPAKNLHLTDSSDLVVKDITLRGETTQETRSGKNLMPFINQDFTLNGVHYFTQNGTLCLNGTSIGETSSKNAKFKEQFSFKLSAGTYTIQQNSGTRLYLYDENDNNIIYVNYGTNGTFTLANETNLYIGFYVYQNIFSNVSANIQIEQGSTATSYEPYGVSPSPDYPSPIVNIEGNVNVKFEGKNLLNYKNPSIKSEYTNTTIENDIVTMEAISTTGAQLTRYDLGVFDPNKTYTASCIGKKIVAGTDGIPNIRLAIYGSNDGTSYTNLDGRTISSPVVGQEYSLSKSVTGYSYYRVYVYNNSNTPVTIGEKSEYRNIMFEQGSTATPYEPHVEQTVLFPLEGQKLMEGSYLADDGIHHRRKQVVLDGSEDGYYSADDQQLTNTYYFSTSWIDNLLGSASFISNNFQDIAVYDNDVEGMRIYFALSDKLRFRLKKSFFTDIDMSTVQKRINAVKTWLSTHPVTVEYELAEEEIIPYTTTQQEAWNNLKKLATYKNITNITSDAKVDTTYRQDLQTLFNKLATALVAIGGN